MIPGFAARSRIKTQPGFHLVPTVDVLEVPVLRNARVPLHHLGGLMEGLVGSVSGHGAKIAGLHRLELHGPVHSSNRGTEAPSPLALHRAFQTT